MINSIMIDFKEDGMIGEYFAVAINLAKANQCEVKFDFWRGSDHRMRITIGPTDDANTCMRLFMRNAPWNRSLDLA